MFKHLFAGLFLALFLVLAIVLAFVYSGLESRPLVEAAPTVQQDDVERIKSLLYAHDPRGLRDGEVRTITVSQRDLNIALRSLLPLPQRQRAQVSLQDNLGALNYTLQLPANSLGAYFNLALALGISGSELDVLWINAGTFRIPGWAVTPLVAVGEHLLERRFAEYRAAREALQEISLRPGEIAVTYRWDAALVEQIEQRGREAFMPTADRERTLAYYRELSALSRRVGSHASLSRLLGSLFALAGRRSGGGDAAAENRSLLLVLGTVLNRSSMHRLVGGNPADLGPMHHYVRWTLAGRNDLAQHFAISSAIAVAGGSVLANAIGAYKELDDSRGGSGFSFPDLLADRAGVELAEAATGSAAENMQRLMAEDGLKESDFMPLLDDLPEGLMEMEFRQRYSDLDDARYGHVKREINTRIALLPLHQR
ncbi:MAG: hypothetical protein V7700_14505 [Halioglobus sp.]